MCEGGEGGWGARRPAPGQSVSGAWSLRLGGRGLTHPGAGSEHGRRVPVLGSLEARDRHIPANPSSVYLSVGAPVGHAPQPTASLRSAPIQARLVVVPVLVLSPLSASACAWVTRSRQEGWASRLGGAAGSRSKKSEW